LNAEQTHAGGRSRGRWQLRLALLALGGLCAVAIIALPIPGWPTAFALLGLVMLVLLADRLLGRALLADDATVAAVADGLASLRDRDYSVSVAVPAGGGSLAQLVGAYNGLGERLRAQRQDLYQRELLLDTVIQATPLALVLTNPNDVVLYANLAARHLFHRGHKLEGLRFTPLLETQPPPLQAAYAAARDQLFTAELVGEPEVFHLAVRGFMLNGQPHRLTLLKQLTRELNAQEVATWKRVIRVIAHEINNSVAPIASLAQSGQRLASAPDEQQLRRVFAAIEERMAHLSGFVDGYSRFAKLPQPRLEPVQWQGFIDGLRAVVPFRIAGALPPGIATFDESQLQQVLINLLKNAREAGSAEDDTEVEVRALRAGWQVEVRDRGSGMSEEVLANALLPFYSTKATGSGLGLTLCREIVEAHGGTLDLANREGGGIVSRIWLPASAVA
jgi:nitrogen fixation/metabolism regulation signal transduction histidine kinase